MYQKIVFYLIFLSFSPSHYMEETEDFCSNDDSVDTVFTLDFFNFAIKNETSVYSKYIGEKLDKEYPRLLSDVFKSLPSLNSKILKTVNTGFMVNKVPDCSTETNCQSIKKLIGIGFVIGTTQSNVQFYRTYRFKNVTSDNYRMIPDLEPMTDVTLPYGLKSEESMSGDFWPIDGSKATYRHSTYVDRIYTLVLIVTENSGKHKAFTLDMKDLLSHGTQAQYKELELTKTHEPSISGFFHWPTVGRNNPFERADNISVYAVVRESPGTKFTFDYFYGLKYEKRFVGGLLNFDEKGIPSIYDCYKNPVKLTTKRETIVPLKPTKGTPYVEITTKEVLNTTSVQLSTTSELLTKTKEVVSTTLVTPQITTITNGKHSDTSLWTIVWILVLLVLIIGFVLLIILFVVFLVLYFYRLHKSVESNK